MDFSPPYASYFESKEILKSLGNFEEKMTNELSTLDIYLNFHENLLAQTLEKQEALGQYHTPESIQACVISSLPEDYVDQIMSGKKLVDPSCGTGNFLIAVIKDALEKTLISYDYKQACSLINKYLIPNLTGCEIDPLMVKAAKAYISKVFDGEIKLPKFIIADMLSDASSKQFRNQFDFVIGNPPWVELKKLPTAVKDFVQKKYSTPNLYSAFIFEAKNIAKEGAYVSFVLPRSFTGGKYFSNVRTLLKNEFKVVEISYFSERKQQFDGGKVLQEMLVLTAQYEKAEKGVMVKCVPRKPDLSQTKMRAFQVLQAEIFSDHDLILLLAENKKEFQWVKEIAKLPNFEGHGFEFSTGQLVPHRSKSFLRESNSSQEDVYRIKYSHDLVKSDNGYLLKPEVEMIKGRPPYAVVSGIKNNDGRKATAEQRHIQSSISKDLNSFKELILMRRKSHRGDSRRFVGCLASNLPEKYFLDNSVNFIYKKNLKKEVSLKAFFNILSSNLFESFFSIISSSTQVNKNDMYLFGMPAMTASNKHIYKKLESLPITDGFKINTLVEELYAREI